MEFEKNRPTTAQDIALAEIPHVTVEPAHRDIRPDVSNSPHMARPDNRNFEFETESTAQTALTTATPSAHPHRNFALLVTIVTVVLFAAALAVLYLLR
jgi:hypothetical protein